MIESAFRRFFQVDKLRNSTVSDDLVTLTNQKHLPGHDLSNVHVGSQKCKVGSDRVSRIRLLNIGVELDGIPVSAIIKELRTITRQCRPFPSTCLRWQENLLCLDVSRPLHSEHSTLDSEIFYALLRGCCAAPPGLDRVPEPTHPSRLAAFAATPPGWANLFRASGAEGCRLCFG